MRTVVQVRCMNKCICTAYNRTQVQDIGSPYIQATPATWHSACQCCKKNKNTFLLLLRDMVPTLLTNVFTVC